MTAITPPPPSPAKASEYAAPPAIAPRHDHAAFAALLDGLSVSHAKARSDGKDRTQAQSAGDGRRQAAAGARAEVRTDPVEGAFASLFASQMNLTASGGLPDAAKRIPSATSPPTAEATGPVSPSELTHPGETAIGARVVGQRTLHLPSGAGEAIASSAWDASRWRNQNVDADRREPAFDPIFAGTSASSPAGSSGLGDLPGSLASLSRSPPVGEGLSAPPRIPAETSQETAGNPRMSGGRRPADGRQTADAQLSQKAAAREANSSLPHAPGSAAQGAGRGRQAADVARDAGSASAFDLASQGGAASIGAAADTSSLASGFPSNAGALAPAQVVSGQPATGETVPARSAILASPARTGHPVREIDLDLSPGGLEDVTMTMRLDGDRLNLVIRAASSETAGAIEGAREAIVERLAAIGQPLGALVIQQTGSTDGTTNANEAFRDDGQAQQQDSGGQRGGERGASRF
jgi:hypothetical protein